MKRVAIASLLGALSACAAPPSELPAADPAGKSARVCVIRPEREAESVTMEVHDNGRLVGATRGATYVCWLALPGEHQIAADADDTGPTLLHAVAGRRYWLHQEVAVLGDHAHAHLDWVDEEHASELLEECRARVMIAVPGHDEEANAMRVVSPR
jgi:hypothetical protein